VCQWTEWNIILLILLLFLLLLLLFKILPFLYLYSSINIVLLLLPGGSSIKLLCDSPSFFLQFSSTCQCPLCSFVVTFLQCSFRRTIVEDFSWECFDFEIVAALSSPLVHATTTCLACWQSFKRVNRTNYTVRLHRPSNNEFRTYNWTCRCWLHRATFLKCTTKHTGRGTCFLM